MSHLLRGRCLFCVTIFICLVSCEFFNLSVPEFIDEYTNTAAAEKWNFITDSLVAPRTGYSVIPPATESGEEGTLIQVQLRNPRRYELIPDVEVIQVGGSIPSVTAEAVYEAPDTILIYLTGAVLHDCFSLTLSLNLDDGRTFESYTIPAISCNTIPLPPESLVVSENAENYPVANWTMVVGGDHNDVNEVVVRYKEGNDNLVTRTYYRKTKDPDVWQSNDGYLLEHDGNSFKSTFPMMKTSGIILDEYYNFHLTLVDDEGLSTTAATPNYGTGVSQEVIINYTQDSPEETVRVTLTAPGSSEIWYTVDGGNPRRYSGTTEVASGTAIKTWSTTPGMTNSQVVTQSIRAQVMYVDPAGIDSADRGWTKTDPVATIAQALTNLKGTGLTTGGVVLMGNVATITAANQVELTDGTLGTINEFVLSGDSYTTQPAINAGGVIDQRVMYIDKNGLTVRLKNLEITGGNLTVSPNISGGGIYLASGSLTVTNGVLITDNDAVTGGGVYMTGGSTFELGGDSIISNNSADNNGGGIYVDGSSRFKMNGGSITGNKAKNASALFFGGGGVYVYGSSFEMNDGTIAGNESLRNGGGLYMHTGTFEMNGGNISSGNQAGVNGGGVFLGGNGVEFIMTNGNIIGNTATAGGGGVYMAGTSKFTMSDGSISSNNADNGGAIYLDYSNAEFNMRGGNITGNAAITKGGGLYVNQCRINIIKGTININNSVQGGGGVYLSQSTFTMEGGSLSGNMVTGSFDGGGVYVDNSDFSMTGGDITGNTAPGNGGGVFLASSGTFSMKGSAHVDTATGNEIYLTSGKAVTIDGDLSNNPAGNITFSGSGVPLLDGSFVLTNYNKFLVNGDPDKIDPAGSYIP